MQRRLVDVAAIVGQLEVFAAVPEVERHEGFEHQAQVGERILEFGIVLGRHLFLFGLIEELVDE